MNLNFLRQVKRKIWSALRLSKFIGPTGPEDGISKINIVRSFPLYSSNSWGEYEPRAELTIHTINNMFPFLLELSKSLDLPDVKLHNIEVLAAHPENHDSSLRLKQLLDKHGSDKAISHNYHWIYGHALGNGSSVSAILEIGIGTNNVDVVSTMGIYGKPGASLRAFRDYCPNAHVYGADIDSRILFSEDRIKTFYLDQTNPKTFVEFKNVCPGPYDLIIDDGLHAPDANLLTLAFGIQHIKPGGWIVIEDISADALPVWQIVSSLIPKNSFQTKLFSCHGGHVFAVQRLIEA